MDKSIPAKLHLGDKMLKSDIIPPGISGIGDWAYAHCSGLKQLALPDTVCNLGKEVFLGCTQLNHVYCYSGDDFIFETLPAEKDAPTHQKAVLNALALKHFTGPLSAIIREKGNDRDQLQTWDKCCLEFLASPDEKGFDPFLAGGEEDYGDNDEQLSSYINEQRRLKAYIVYTRLMSAATGSLPMDNETQELYYKIFGSSPGALPLLNDINSHCTAAADIYKKAGLLNTKALPDILASLDPDRIEMRAALINGSSDSLLSGLVI